MHDISPAPPPPPAERFARLIAAPCAALGARVTRPGQPGLAFTLLMAVRTG